MAYISKIKIPGNSNAYDVKDANAEVSSNKVTSWSSTTTNAHYPSEKLVKASLDDKADVEEVKTTGDTTFRRATSYRNMSVSERSTAYSFYTNVSAGLVELEHAKDKDSKSDELLSIKHDGIKKYVEDEDGFLDLKWSIGKDGTTTGLSIDVSQISDLEFMTRAEMDAILNS